MHIRRRTIAAMAALTMAAAAAPSHPVAAASTPQVDVTPHTPNHASAGVVAIGTEVHLEVLVRGNGAPLAGNVRITFFRAAGCTGSSSASPLLALADGEVDGGFIVKHDGPFAGSFRAHYLPADPAAWSEAASECVEVTWKAPLDSMVSVLHDASHSQAGAVAIGDKVHLRTMLSGSHGAVIGTIRDYAFSNMTCSGSGTLLRTATGDAALAVEPPLGVGYAATVPGIYAQQTHFSASATYLTRTGTCLAYRVKAHPAATVAVVDADGTPLSQLPAGSQFYVRAVASGSFGTPSGSGSIAFHALRDCGGLGFAEAVTLSDGRAVLGPRTAQLPGYQSVRFTYGGNLTYFAATSDCANLNVVPPTATTTPTTRPTTAPTTQSSSQPTAATSQPAAVASPSTTVAAPSAMASIGSGASPAVSAPASGAGPLPSPGSGGAEATTDPHAPSVAPDASASGGSAPTGNVASPSSAVPAAPVASPAESRASGAAGGAAAVPMAIVLAVVLVTLLVGLAVAVLAPRRLGTGRVSTGSGR